MITDTTGCNEETLGADDEDVNYLKAQVSKLSAENDQYKQELYELNRKYEISRDMEEEMGEFQKILEQTLEQEKIRTNRRIHEIEDKYHKQIKEFQDKFCEMELELSKKIEENRSLQETIKTTEERLSVLNQSQHSTFIEDHSESLKSQVEVLTMLLEQEKETRKHYEETGQMIKKELDELKEILTATKKQLTEKNEVVESIKGELMECKAELEATKTVEPTEKSKGNSLFAEVEDRRKMTLGQMTAMRDSYLEAKRTYQAKEAEIKSLKAERTLLLRKWEDDTVEKIQQDASLIEKYKSRIGDLESRLKEEQKKQKQNTKSQQLPENSYTYLQSLVDSKTKLIEELSGKIENDSLKVLLDEEQKHKMGKQLRYWRFKALSGETELLSIKKHLESDPSSKNSEILETITKCLNNKSIQPEEFFENESTYAEPTLVNETVITFDKLITFPKPFSTKKLDLTDVDDTIGSLKSLNEETLSMDETEICSNFIDTTQQPRSYNSTKIQDHVKENNRKPPSMEKEQNKENSSTLGNKGEKLKPMINKENQDQKSILVHKEKFEREKKSLRFAKDTVDPPGNPVRKNPEAAPKYPIVFISSKKSKE